MGAKPRAELAAVEEWHGSWSVAFCPVVAVVPRLTRMGQALTADLRTECATHLLPASHVADAV